VIDETFTTMEERFGEMVTIDLKPGGADVAVTEENKKEYVDLVVEYRISKRVKDQFDAFMSGFSELIPQDLINVFDERELELLIGGMSEIDVYVSPSLSDPRAEISSKGRLDQVHRLPRIRGQRRSDSMVLEMCTFLAGGTQITFTAVRNGYLAHSCQWLQGFTRLRRTEALHNREGRRPEPFAEESYMLQPH
jgi:hypothetical protein